MNRRLFLLSATAVTALGACAPMALQSPLTPAADFAGPSLEGDWFTSFDGARLGATLWPAVGETRVALVALHGMNDYANAFHLAAPDWAARGIATYAFDQRGFGRSVGRGIWAGRELMSEDLRVFVDLVKARHPGVPVVVAGESMGGAVAICAFASDRPPAADRLLLLAPAVWGWSSQPLPNKTLLWITARVTPGQPIEPPGWLADVIHPSDNTEEMIAMGRDRLMIWGARPDTISGLVDLMEAAWSEIGAVKVPVAYLYGANDEVIPETPSRQAANRLKPGDKTAWYAKGYHLLIRDHQRQTVIEDAASFILTPEAPLPSGMPRIPRPGVKPSRV
ncbi:MAG: alpha/beta hydrolase [Caulobacteraceae bacterium]|nr:MAG: alpha/beta hydrolase [Caulobacteraceae bacterium]